MKKGFTLSELMAVVVIIAIIASIGLGGYKRTVERAKLTEGLNVAHQIAQALVRADWDRSNSCGAFDTPWTQLDVSVTGALVSDDSVTIPNRFIITKPENAAFLKVERQGGERYTLEVPIDCGTNHVKLKDRCTGNTDFCISAGFSSCTDNVCSKP